MTTKRTAAAAAADLASAAYGRRVRNMKPSKVVNACEVGGLSTAKQGRQDSNLQPPVLETGALPIELRP